MRSFKTIAVSGAALAAGLVLGVPAAHAATAPQDHSAACRTAVEAAKKADAAYDSALADLKKQIADGGHPGMAEEDNVKELRNAANLATSDAARICGVTTGTRPHGGMHTGAGSTSQGASTTEITAGLGLIGAAGAGAVALRRRKAGGAA